MAKQKLTSQMDRLWEQLRNSICFAYTRARENGDGDLRDYADEGMRDKLRDLLNREIQYERQHRRGWKIVAHSPLNVIAAAQLVLMSQILNGADLEGMPEAVIFLRMRPTAAEARVLGCLIRKELSDEWRAEVASLDYAKLVTA